MNNKKSSPNQCALAWAILLSLAMPCAHAAHLVKLDSTVVSKSSAQSIYEFSGLQQPQLEPIESTSVDGGVLVRFAQYFDGYPIYGAYITAELGVSESADGNAYIAPVKSLLSGYQALDFEEDLKGFVMEMDKDQAFAVTKAFHTETILSVEREYADPYIFIDQSGRARKVFLVVISGNTTNGAFQTSTLMDRVSGAVIERWDSLDQNDGNGPGQVLEAVRSSLAAQGWSDDKISNLLHHAHKFYWTNNIEMSQSSCGADHAAADLGYNIAEVRQAFNQNGKCRSNRRNFQISQPVPSIAEPGKPTSNHPPLSHSKTVGDVSYGDFTPLAHGDMIQMSNLSTGKDVIVRADKALGYDSVFNPNYVTEIKINSNKYTRVGKTSLTSTCGDLGTCVSGRLNRITTAESVDDYSGWITWPGTTSQTEQSSGSSVTFPREFRWGTQTQNSDTTTSTILISQQLKGSVAFLDAFNAEYSITYSPSMATTHTDTATTNESFYSPKFKLPANCTAKMTLRYRFKLAKRTFDIKTDLSGWIRGISYNYLTFATSTERMTAENFFGPWEGVTAYRSTQTAKENMETKVEIIGYKTSSPGTTCTITYL